MPPVGPKDMSKLAAENRNAGGNPMISTRPRSKSQDVSAETPG
jgi:hypothetical protein